MKTIPASFRRDHPGKCIWLGIHSGWEAVPVPEEWKSRPGSLGALKEAGIAYNEELTRMYQDFQPKRQKTSTLESWPEESCRLYEPDITDTEYYTEDCLKTQKSIQIQRSW